MFDLRYHVASLAAVFLALIIGILLGVGISSGGFLKQSERSLLNRQIADLQNRLDAETGRAGGLAQSQRAAQIFIKDTYPALMADRLRGRHVAVVFVGSINTRARALVERALADADAPRPLRLRAITVPVDASAIDRALDRRVLLSRYTGNAMLGELGQELASEFVSGGKTPLWTALQAQLVEERLGNDKRPADAVVVVRSTVPQRGQTALLLAGFYKGLAAAGVPAVGVETTGARESAVPAFRKAHLTTVDDVDTPAGRFALALALEGGATGAYGIKQTARDGLLPPVSAAPTSTPTIG